MNFVGLLFIIVLLLGVLFFLELSQMDTGESSAFAMVLDQPTYATVDQTSFSFESKTITVYHYDEVLKVNEKRVCY